MNKMNKDNQYWFENVNILIDMSKLDEFIPIGSMTYAQKVNSIIRLSIYVGLGLMVILRNYLYLYIPILAMALSYVLYLFRKADKDNNKSNIMEGLSQQLGGSSLNNTFNIEDAQNKIEQFSDGSFTEPSLENPFMNPMPFDNRNRPEAAPLEPDTVVGVKTEKYFNGNLFKDVSDIFAAMNSRREFYTVPSTTYPSRQDNFADWLYKTPPTCKEGNGNQCVSNNEDRLRGSSFKLPYNNSMNSKIFM